MKKLLTILSTIVLTSSTSTSIIACSESNKKSADKFSVMTGTSGVI